MVSARTTAARESFERAVRESKRRGVLLTTRDALAAACCDDRLHRGHRRVLVAICNHINGTTGMAFPGRARLAELTGLAISTIGPTVSALRRLGYVVDDRRAPKPGERALTHYAIRLPDTAEVVAGDAAEVVAGDAAEVVAGDTAEVVAGDAALTSRETHRPTQRPTHRSTPASNSFGGAAAEYAAARAGDDDHDQQQFRQRRPGNEAEWRALLQWLLHDPEGRQAPWNIALYGRLPGEPGYWVPRSVLDECGGPAAVGEKLAPRAIGKRHGSFNGSCHL